MDCAAVVGDGHEVNDVPCGQLAKLSRNEHTTVMDGRPTLCQRPSFVTKSLFGWNLYYNRRLLSYDKAKAKCSENSYSLVDQDSIEEVRFFGHLIDLVFVFLKI